MLLEDDEEEEVRDDEEEEVRDEEGEEDVCCCCTCWPGRMPISSSNSHKSSDTIGSSCTLIEEKDAAAATEGDEEEEEDDDDSAGTLVAAAAAPPPAPAAEMPLLLLPVVPARLTCRYKCSISEDARSQRRNNSQQRVTFCEPVTPTDVNTRKVKDSNASKQAQQKRHTEPIGEPKTDRRRRQNEDKQMPSRMGRVKRERKNLELRRVALEFRDRCRQRGRRLDGRVGKSEGKGENWSGHAGGRRTHARATSKHHPAPPTFRVEALRSATRMVTAANSLRTVWISAAWPSRLSRCSETLDEIFSSSSLLSALRRSNVALSARMAVSDEEDEPEEAAADEAPSLASENADGSPSLEPDAAEANSGDAATPAAPLPPPPPPRFSRLFVIGEPPPLRVLGDDGAADDITGFRFLFSSSPLRKMMRESARTGGNKGRMRRWIVQQTQTH